MRRFSPGKAVATVRIEGCVRRVDRDRCSGSSASSRGDAVMVMNVSPVPFEYTVTDVGSPHTKVLIRSWSVALPATLWNRSTSDGSRNWGRSSEVGGRFSSTPVERNRVISSSTLSPNDLIVKRSKRAGIVDRRGQVQAAVAISTRACRFGRRGRRAWRCSRTPPDRAFQHRDREPRTGRGGWRRPSPTPRPSPSRGAASRADSRAGCGPGGWRSPAGSTSNTNPVGATTGTTSSATGSTVEGAGTVVLGAVGAGGRSRRGGRSSGSAGPSTPTARRRRCRRRSGRSRPVRRRRSARATGRGVVGFGQVVVVEAGEIGWFVAPEGELARRQELDRVAVEGTVARRSPHDAQSRADPGRWRLRRGRGRGPVRSLALSAPGC